MKIKKQNKIICIIIFFILLCIPLYAQPTVIRDLRIYSGITLTSDTITRIAIGDRISISVYSDTNELLPLRDTCSIRIQNSRGDYRIITKFK